MRVRFRFPVFRDECDLPAALAVRLISSGLAVPVPDEGVETAVEAPSEVRHIGRCKQAAEAAKEEAQ